MDLKDFIRQFLVKIEEYEHIALFVHIQPDFDAYASAFGIKKGLKDNFPEKKTYLIIPPDTFREEEKFLFNSEDDLPSEVLIRKCLGIVVDTPNADRILTNLYLHCKELVVIDHHQKQQEFASLVFIDPTYPAVSQILAEVFFHLEKKGYEFSEELSQYFYAGILTDTNNLMSPSTIPSTFDVVSKLASKGLNRTEIHDFIFVRDMNRALFNAQVIKNSSLTSNGLIYSIVGPRLVKKYDMHKYPHVVNILSNIANVEIWSALSYNPRNKKWKCSIRSKDLAVNHIAKLYGGGGHKTMAAVVFDKGGHYYRLLATLDEYLIKCGYGNTSLKDVNNVGLILKLHKVFNLYKAP